MSIRKELLKGASEDPLGLRRTLEDPEVVIALSSVGILPKILELHAASPTQERVTVSVRHCVVFTVRTTKRSLVNDAG